MKKNIIMVLLQIIILYMSCNLYSKGLKMDNEGVRSYPYLTMIYIISTTKITQLETPN